MTDGNYNVTVVHRDAEQAVGVKVRTTMDKAFEDCPRLWSEIFAPRMPEVITFPSHSFGISVMVDEAEGSFDYWAALPWHPGDPVPEGMAVFDLPEGRYAECRVTSLAELAPAYQHIFSVWAPSSGYELPEDLPSYEYYPADHLETGRLVLYMPVRAREKT